jgi:type IV pilus assembly protein PilB
MAIPLDATLRLINRQTEEATASQLAQRLSLPYALLENYPFNLDTLALVPLPIVQERSFAVYLKTASQIKVAVVHPENKAVLDEIGALAANLGVTVEPTVVSNSSMQGLIKSYLVLLHEREELDKQHVMEASAKAEKDYFAKIKSVDDFAKELETASITDMVDVVLAAGYNQHASDIHLEPGENVITVRFRIDGVLQKVLDIDMKNHKQLISRVKMMSNLKLDETSTIQDGRFGLGDKGINADIRVSTIPTAYGEGIVMRILRQDMQKVSITELGFNARNKEVIERVIRKPYGLILVTGPTGSGKSTTLYSILEELNTSEKKIITLEDPVEYRIAGLQQSQVVPEKGFTFAEGLRGALRQDPDVVMVGEIRDPETATIALNASLTGHLVLSTLHTNNAVTAATRFMEMGIAPFLLNGSIQMIIAQRLVRKLVPGSDPANPQYAGRIIIAEVLCPNQEFEQAVLQRQDQVSLEQIAIRGGMVPMQQDGLEKVRLGLTTEAEISRVTEV